MKKVLLSCVALACLASTGFAEEKPKKEGKKPDLAAVFKKLDKDGSGDLTLAEMTGKRDAEKAKKAFERLDKDKNGKVSLEEFKNRPMKKKGDK